MEQSYLATFTLSDPFYTQKGCPHTPQRKPPRLKAEHCTPCWKALRGATVLTLTYSHPMAKDYLPGGMLENLPPKTYWRWREHLYRSITGTPVRSILFIAVPPADAWSSPISRRATMSTGHTFSKGRLTGKPGLKTAVRLPTESQSFT